MRMIYECLGGDDGLLTKMLAKNELQKEDFFEIVEKREINDKII